MDLNRVWISGTVVSDPVYSALSSGTESCVFTLQVNEQFKDRDGSLRVKSNAVRVECLGHQARKAKELVRTGRRYFVDGYLRIDTGERGEFFRVRSYKIQKDDSEASSHHIEGIRHALAVLKKSRSVESAIKSLEESISP